MLPPSLVRSTVLLPHPPFPPPTPASSRRRRRRVFALDSTRRARRRETLAFQPSEQSPPEFLRSSWDWRGVLAKSGPSQLRQVGSTRLPGLSSPTPCPRSGGVGPPPPCLFTSGSDRKALSPPGGRAHPAGRSLPSSCVSGRGERIV